MEHFEPCACAFCGMTFPLAYQVAEHEEVCERRTYIGEEEHAQP